MTRARRWREQQGYAICPVCREPSPQQPCRACTLTLQDPNVKRAALRLSRGAGSLDSLAATLGDSGSEAARYLALAGLAEQLEVLAVECVQSGNDDHYRAFLREQADVYLKLFFRRLKLSRADWNALPDKPRQVLSAGHEQY